MEKKEDKTLQIITHVIGIVAYLFGPLLIFILTKDKGVKKHARNALNWQISLAIYYIFFLTLSGISALLTDLDSGIYILLPFSLILGVLTLLNLIFSIIAAVKASENELWKYPLSINFIEQIGEKEIDKEIRKGKREVKKAIKEIKKEFKQKKRK